MISSRQSGVVDVDSQQSKSIPPLPRPFSFLPVRRSSSAIQCKVDHFRPQIQQQPSVRLRKWCDGETSKSAHQHRHPLKRIVKFQQSSDGEERIDGFSVASPCEAGGITCRLGDVEHLQRSVRRRPAQPSHTHRIADRQRRKRFARFRGTLFDSSAQVFRGPSANRRFQCPAAH